MNEVETQERIAKAWYLKQYLSQLEKLLIEEQCHTANDSKAFRQLLDLVERDTPKKVIQKRLGDIPVHCCPDCGYSYDSFCVQEMRVKPEACPRCGQRLDWSE